MITDLFKNWEEDTLKTLGISYVGLSMCELGNQSYNNEPAKIMYEKRGAKHTSIDINGRSGSLPLDLDYPIPNNLENKFDLITNYGTTEHVNNQYSVFKNIHSVGKVGCVVVHGVPLVNNWKKHCRWYYSIQFFSSLASACSYKIIGLEIVKKNFYKYPKNLVACIFRKEKENLFIKEKDFYSLPGLYDSKDTRRTGNYS